MSSVEDLAADLTEPMRRTLRMAYRPNPETHPLRWRIPPYCYAGTVLALQRRGLADEWLLTADGIIVRGLISA